MRFSKILKLLIEKAESTDRLFIEVSSGDFGFGFDKDDLLEFQNEMKYLHLDQYVDINERNSGCINDIHISCSRTMFAALG